MKATLPSLSGNTSSFSAPVAESDESAIHYRDDRKRTGYDPKDIPEHLLSLSRRVVPHCKLCQLTKLWHRMKALGFNDSIWCAARLSP